MNARLWGIGTCLPAHSISQENAALIAARYCTREVEQARRVAVVYRGSGIRKRGSVLLNAPGEERVDQDFFEPPEHAEDYGPGTAQRMGRYQQEAVPLILSAARQALDQADVAPAEVTHVITVSCTGFFSPGPDIALIDGLGLPPSVGRTHIGFMGCHAALNGLQVAGHIIGANPEAVVLLACIELCTLHFSYGYDAERVVANALFADGAAAALLGGGGRRSGWRLAATGSRILPDSPDAMSWRIGDNGFIMTLSAEVPEIIARHAPGFLGEWLGDCGLSLAEVKSWAVHPGGPRILTTLEQALGLDPAATRVSREVLSHSGNMSSATVLFVLEELLASGAEAPCVALAFGPGLAAEAALFLP